MIIDSFSFYAATFFYLIDIIVNLRTSYFNDLGKEVTDVKLISKNYIWSFEFWLIDLLCIIPWYKIFGRDGF